jgi:hypothetical protein
MVLLQGKEGFFHSLEKGYFAQKLCSLHFKSLRDRQNAFQKLTQFSLLNQVLEPLAANIHGFLPW